MIHRNSKRQTRENDKNDTTKCSEQEEEKSNRNLRCEYEYFSYIWFGTLPISEEEICVITEGLQIEPSLIHTKRRSAKQNKRGENYTFCEA